MRFDFLNYKSKKTLKENTYLYFSMLIILPAVIVLISWCITTFFNYQNTKEQIYQNNLASLKLFAQSCENEISDVIHASSLFVDNTEFYNALQNKADLNDNSIVFSLKNTILNFQEAYPTIDSIQIVNQDDNYVISSDGVLTIDKYYDYVYSYNNYGKEYWTRLKFFDNSPYRILSPSKVLYAERNKIIIPIVFDRIGDSRLNNYLVVNLSLNTILSAFDNYRQTENADIYLLNKYTGQIFSEKNGSCTDILNTPLHKELLANNDSFTFEFDGIKNAFIVKFTTSGNIIGYTYFAVIPPHDIFRMQSDNFIRTTGITLLFIFAALVLSAYHAKKIIAPLQKMITAYNLNNSQDSKDVLGRLESVVSEIYETNLALSKTLPFAQEKYLINYLNSAEYSIDESSQNIIRDSLPFTHEYFATIILQLYPTEQFYNTYTAEDYKTIQIGFYNIVKEHFSTYYETFLLSSEKETLYIILNVEDNEQMEQINKLLDEVCGFLKYDEPYARVYIGIGGIYEGLPGLRQAHTEAVASLKIVPRNEPQVVIQTATSVNPLFTDAEESLLYTTLLAFDTEKATAQIKNFRDNLNNTDHISIKQFYTQIITIILRVMRVKNIPMPDNMLEHQILSDILNKPITEVWRGILNLLDLLNSYQLRGETKTDIVTYIQQNFSDKDLSLDQLAVLFNLQPNYVSNLIKSNLGIGFHEYVTQLRMAQAKKLLISTDKNIQEIYESSGFSNKQTFFRVFKEAVGTTPNQYRKEQQNSKGK